MQSQQGGRTGVVREGTVQIFGRSLTYYIEFLGPLIGMIIFSAIMVIFRPHFLSSRNVINILYQASVYMVMAVGMTFVITGAGIDLSVGSILALSGVMMSFFVKFTELPVFLGIFIALGVGALAGLINGLLIVKLRLPDFIATIATMIGYRGITLIMAGGMSLYAFPDTITFLGGHRLFGFLPVSIIVAFMVGYLGYYMYYRTKFGRYTVAMGGDREAAVLSGIDVDKYKILNFVFMGLLAGLAGLLTVGRLDAFHATYGQMYEIDVIAAVIIGGTSLFGGIGKVWGSVAGALLLGMVANGMVILRLPYFYQYAAVAVVILLAVSVYTLTGVRGNRGQ